MFRSEVEAKVCLNDPRVLPRQNPREQHHASLFFFFFLKPTGNIRIVLQAIHVGTFIELAIQARSYLEDWLQFHEKVNEWASLVHNLFLHSE